MGDHVGDDPDAVEANRRRVADAAGLADPTRWVWINQVHGIRVHHATELTAAELTAAELTAAELTAAELTAAERTDQPPEADAAVTAVRGLPLAVVTADCAPIALASDTAIGVVHAGHRGLELGVVEAAVTALRAIGTGEVRAYLGPCIHPDRYEFGSEDLARLVARFGAGVEGRTLAGRPALDIPVAVKRALEECDVVAFSDADVCTSESAAHFSYRRDGVTGRQVTIAVLP